MLGRGHRAHLGLQDVSFEVQHGEVVGIIGRNGAGKSTLLKILSQITEPTTGTIDIYGRVGALLEVGTGFHPELTGRENVYLNGAILGMTRHEIARKFDEIVDFSGIEAFIDTPVKHYSSGMQMRLAFAVAAHLDPEILIVDEVLAVGDAEFQKKCLGKMSDVTREGRTVLFVSHNMGAVQSLCTRGVLLEAGRVELDDRTERVVSHYLNRTKAVHPERIWEHPEEAPGNDAIRLRRVCVRPANGQVHDTITVRTPLVVEFEYWNLVPDTKLNLSVAVYNEMGTLAFITTSVMEPHWHGKKFPRGLFQSVMQIPGDLLNDGLHMLTTLFVENEGHVIATFTDLISFDVEDSQELRGNWHGKWNGVVRPFLAWETRLCAEVQ
ncbi:MAG: ABC transporter ATP-binding protein [Cyanobacteria bacterium M5B4]|nr:MAG: ABC transporter ATP-binding protein [Cyanobacteria bacterium M5B4]